MHAICLYVQCACRGSCLPHSCVKGDHNIPDVVIWHYHSKLVFTPESRMEVGCLGTWGLSCQPLTQVARTPQMPALPAT